MKTALLTATIALFLGSAAAYAAPAMSPASSPASSMDPRGLYTCAGKSVSRVALAEAPHECCTGLMGCPQLLANTAKLRIRRDNRT